MPHEQDMNIPFDELGECGYVTGRRRTIIIIDSQKWDEHNELLKKQKGVDKSERILERKYFDSHKEFEEEYFKRNGKYPDDLKEYDFEVKF